MHRDRFYLSDRIRMYIENSHLEGGGRLPSNEELAERFKVQKGTVRAALERLKEEGIVYSVKGVEPLPRKRKYSGTWSILNLFPKWHRKTEVP